MAVGKVRPDAMRLRVNDPDFFGAVSEIEFHLEIELRCGVGFGSDLNGKRGRAFEISARPWLFDLGGPYKANIRLQASIRRQAETDFHHHVAKTALAHVSSENIKQLMLDLAVIKFRRRQDDVLSLQKLVLVAVVRVFLELF